MSLFLDDLSGITVFRRFGLLWQIPILLFMSQLEQVLRMNARHWRCLIHYALLEVEILLDHLQLNLLERV